MRKATGHLGDKGAVEAGLRVAALAYLSPLLVALLHQHDLAGVTCRPLDLEAFLAAHTSRFVRAYGAPGFG